MSILNALGYFIRSCDCTGEGEGLGQEQIQSGIQAILRSPEGRFAACRTVQDVLRELGWSTEPIRMRAG